MKLMTPKKVYRIALKATIKAINEQLRKQRKIIFLVGESVDPALRGLQDNKKLLEEVIRQFTEVGWIVEYKGISQQALSFRTEPQKEQT